MVEICSGRHGKALRYHGSPVGFLFSPDIFTLVFNSQFKVIWLNCANIYAYYFSYVKKYLKEVFVCFPCALAELPAMRARDPFCERWTGRVNCFEWLFGFKLQLGLSRAWRAQTERNDSRERADSEQQEPTKDSDPKSGIQILQE